MNVTCPTCQTEIKYDQRSPFRPFCSKKCQLIDFGTWANEENAIPVTQDELVKPQNSVNIEDIEAMLAEQGSDFFRD